MCILGAHERKGNFLNFSDFKESPFMYALGLAVVVFVIAQSLFFIIKAWKHGKKIGIPTATMKNTVLSSALFSIAPAISILTTVIVLASALGIVLPWIRLSVIGNLAYETVAASSTLEVLGSSLTMEITDKTQFAAVSWVMTVGSVFPLILMPIICKKIQSKIGDVVNKNEKNAKWADTMAAAAFIGIIAAFIARSINGATANSDGVITESSGFISICVLVCAIVFMLVLDLICRRFKLTKLEPFTMPIAMFGAMGMAILLTNVLPDSLVNYYWYL